MKKAGVSKESELLTVLLLFLITTPKREKRTARDRHCSNFPNHQKYLNLGDLARHRMSACILSTWEVEARESV